MAVAPQLNMAIMGNKMAVNLMLNDGDDDVEENRCEWDSIAMGLGLESIELD